MIVGGGFAAPLLRDTKMDTASRGHEQMRVPSMPGQHTDAPSPEPSSRGHCAHVAEEFAPRTALYRPAEQFKQAVKDEPPSDGLYVPIGQLMGKPAMQYEPAGHWCWVAFVVPLGQ